MNRNENEDIVIKLQKDLEWRENEINMFDNILDSLSDDNSLNQDVYRKGLVLILYAHFEGFFRFTFEAYAYLLNESRIEMDKAVEVLNASALNEQFYRYDNQNKWITSDNEHDNKRILNRVHLLNELQNRRSQILELPISADHKNKSSVVFTESNLNPDVINRILYGLGIHQELGLEKREFNQLMGLINAFIKRRNGIAHGDGKSEYREGVSAREYNSFKDSFDRIVRAIISVIQKSLREKLYLKEEYR